MNTSEDRFSPTARRCNAHAKGTGQPCKNPAVAGFNVCRMHGAGSPHKGRPGGRPPTHGRYSVQTKASIRERAEQYLDDPRALDLERELAMLRATVDVVVDRIDEQPTVDTEDVRILAQTLDKVGRTVERTQKLLQHDGLTAAELKILEAKFVEVVLRYVPSSERRRCMEEFATSLRS